MHFFDAGNLNGYFIERVAHSFGYYGHCCFALSAYSSWISTVYLQASLQQAFLGGCGRNANLFLGATPSFVDVCEDRE